MEASQLVMNQERQVTLPWLGFSLCAVAYLFGGTASTLMATYLPVVVRQLVGSRATEAELSEVSAWIGAAFLYGWMAGGLAFGPIADRLGRVLALVLATGLCGLAMLATTLVPGVWALLVIRMLTGAGVGGILLVSTVYLAEVWPASSRPVALGVLATLFPVGIVTTGALVSGLSDWKLAFSVGGIPLVVAALMGIFLPESISWKQRSNTVESLTTPRLFDAENRPNVLSGALIFGSVLIGLWGIFSWLPTWVQSLLPAGQSGQTERGVTMLLLGTGGILGSVASGFLVKTIGPRSTLLATFAGCIGASILLFLTNRSFAPVIYGELALLSLFFGISQGALSSYVPSLFPAFIRGTATGFCFNVGRLFTATAVLFVGALVRAMGGYGNALMLFSGAFIIAFTAVCLNSERVKE
jgi:predicted MFS family arabinose efflux permease